MLINQELVAYFIEYLENTTNAVTFQENRGKDFYAYITTQSSRGSSNMFSGRDSHVYLSYNQTGLVTKINGVAVNVSQGGLLSKAINDHIRRSFKFKRKKQKLTGAATP